MTQPTPRAIPAHPCYADLAAAIDRALAEEPPVEAPAPGPLAELFALLGELDEIAEAAERRDAA